MYDVPSFWAFDYDFNPMPIEVCLKAPKWETAVTLPGCAYDLRLALDNIPEELCISKEFACDGWATYVTFSKAKASEILNFLYGGKIPDDVWRIICSASDDTLKLLGFWD